MFEVRKNGVGEDAARNNPCEQAEYHKHGNHGFCESKPHAH